MGYEMHQLEKYYPGDKEWKNFIRVFSENWANCRFQNELIEELNGDEEIAKVIFVCVPTNTLNWIKKTNKMLDNLTVKDCLIDKVLILRLKTMLMRLPGR